MNEKILLRIALGISILGLIILFLLMNIIEPNETSLRELQQKEINEHVQIKGIITGIHDYNKTIFLDIVELQPITVVAFSDGKMKLENNSKVSIDGQIQLYGGKKELIVNEVKKIK
jgi:aspartyl-tRNA synthetase